MLRRKQEQEMFERSEYVIERQRVREWRESDRDVPVNASDEEEKVCSKSGSKSTV